MVGADRVLRDGAAAALELAARRGPSALEATWGRLTLRQRALVPADLLDQLRREAAQPKEAPHARRE